MAAANPAFRGRAPVGVCKRLLGTSALDNGANLQKKSQKPAVEGASLGRTVVFSM